MKQYCETCLVHGKFRSAVRIVNLIDNAKDINLLNNVPLCEEHLEIIDSFVQQANLPLRTPRLTITLTRTKQ